MTQIELQNIQEAVVISLGFSIEFSLALVLVLAVYIAVCMLFAIPPKREHHDR
jgi:hypothetical protein